MLETGAGIGPFVFAARTRLGESGTIQEKNRRMLKNALRFFEATETDEIKIIHRNAFQPVISC